MSIVTGVFVFINETSCGSGKFALPCYSADLAISEDGIETDSLIAVAVPTF